MSCLFLQLSVDLECWVFGDFFSPHVLTVASSRVRLNCVDSNIMSCVSTKSCSFTDVVLVLPSVKIKHFHLFINLRFLIEQKPYSGLRN